MRRIFFFCLIIFSCSHTFAQDDLLSMLTEESHEKPEVVKASFKTTRVINAHSLENVAGGVLDLRISHRFGYISGGLYELYGLDAATMRLGFEYGLTDRFMIGLGRSTIGKTYDGFLKYRIIRQTKGSSSTPFTLIYFSSMAWSSLKPANSEQKQYETSNMSYVHQLIFGKKFSEGFSAEILPTLVHRNLVKDKTMKHDVIAIGGAFRKKLTRRTSLNGEYFYVLPNQIDPIYQNSFSLGFDIETGGHVFQLHFTNSVSMIEKGFITETQGAWGKGDIHLGFNLSRVFTLRRPRAN